ncbi:hypothetical protein BIW11_00009 [Tropilaelaps mercedesae]|uniref:Carbohydrate kinase PfkB domain-containing protein n=1 Tax=Tropilaelaps mercedesae TaxID=418985 RepID=A0A1V9Y3S8_9ACAR|nr:hypothetical protein BIW11_00009 [Tropilaelaps mercedesae]
MSLYHFSPEVRSALKNKEPIVSLESTIITHGMPYPDNLKTAMDVEQVVRRAGAVPATVALIKGEIHVGLSEQLLGELASVDNTKVKISKRDLAPAIAQKMTGGTTVAGTIVVSHKAGVSMFVTGGIGGVHRGAEVTMDVSADLVELGRTPVTVVSAGVKSILDIEKTLEFLETQGVCVATYGESKEFPCFWTKISGFQVPWNVRDPAEAAALVASRKDLDLQSGILITNPIPTNHEADGKFIEKCVQEALKETAIQRIKGKDITPFILSRVHHATRGVSLKSNIALIKHNALVGSLIAKELATIRPESVGIPEKVYVIPSLASEPINASRPVLIGGSGVDFNIKLEADEVQQNGDTYKGKVFQGYGGVARNMADCISRLGLNPLLVSAVGDDLNGKGILRHNSKMDKRGISVLRDALTATCCAVHNKSGLLLYNVGDMDIHDRITPEMVIKFEKEISAAPMVILDGNVPEDALQTASEMCVRLKKPVWYEPTCATKSTKPFRGDRVSSVWYTSPNKEELELMYHDLTKDGPVAGDALTQAAKMAIELLRSGLIRHAVYATLGERGLVRVVKTNDVYDIIHFEAPQAATVKTANGAGDCQAATIITGMVLGLPEDDYMGAAMEIPLLSLASYSSVPDTLSRNDLNVKNITKARRLIV